MHGFIEPFYEPSKTGHPDAIERGEIYEDQPIYLPARHGLKITKVDPMDDNRLDLEITGRTEDIFRHPPITRPKLPSGEALIVGQAKWARPVIVLAGEGVDLFAGPGVVKPANTFLCAPVYGGEQFSEEIRRRVRAYEYPNMFYLPQSTNPLFDEGLVRFDHMQAIRRSDLRRRRSARLADDALDALEEWLFHYLTGRLPADSLVAEYREEELEKLDPTSGSST
ncbi:MAG: hypothetical protein WD739_10930 [Actinomycetota bacterium]